MVSLAESEEWSRLQLLYWTLLNIILSGKECHQETVSLMRCQGWVFCTSASVDFCRFHGYLMCISGRKTPQPPHSGLRHSVAVSRCKAPGTPEPSYFSSNMSWHFQTSMNELAYICQGQWGYNKDWCIVGYFTLLTFLESCHQASK